MGQQGAMGRRELVGNSSVHIELLLKLERIAKTDAEVLISGPSGVGKELYARRLHDLSRRSERAFVPVNCGALNADLLENELFGHVAGAFTGARPVSEGLVAEAEGGTLFLDEVDSLLPAGQVKLLRFLQDKEYRRLGETRLRRANVRFVAATNADLAGLVKDGRFRSDLFFRLRVVPLEVPALCERREDIVPLFNYYAERYGVEYGAPPLEVSPEAQRLLEEYPWPGNVRELENCVRYLVCMRLAAVVRPTDLPLLTDSPAPVSTAATGGNLKFQQAKSELVSRFERGFIEDALQRSNGNIARAAQDTGKARRAFFELMRKHGIDAARFRPAEEPTDGAPTNTNPQGLQS
jgi:two-component system, NtrC family, response regulator GlrR